MTKISTTTHDEKEIQYQITHGTNKDSRVHYQTNDVGFYLKYPRLLIIAAREITERYFDDGGGDLYDLDQPYLVEFFIGDSAEPLIGFLVRGEPDVVFYSEEKE